MTGVIATLPKMQFSNALGLPMSGGTLTSYLAGTTTPVTTYQDEALTSANTNPISLDSRGECTLWLDSTKVYKFVLKNAAGVTQWTVDNITNSTAFAKSLDTQLRADLAASSGASLVGYLPAGTGTATTVNDKLLDFSSVLDFGATADGVTDNTSLILSAALSGIKTIIIPSNVKYDKTTLLQSLSPDVVLVDLSSINDDHAIAQTTKNIGIVSSDVAESDTHWSIASGHHAITTLNNFGTAATSSALERKVSLLWAVGNHQIGSIDKRGFRGAAIQQFTKESGGSNNYWKWQIRSIAPWLSISGQYEYWAQGQSISGAGIYREGTTSQHYVSASAGTTGATPPTHTSGTVSDGGVDWTWIDSADRTLFQVDQYGRWLTGQGDGLSQWRHKVSTTSPNGNYTFQGEATGVSKNASLQLIPTNASGVAVNQPYFLAQYGVGTRIMKSDGSTDVGYFSDLGFIAKTQWVTCLNVTSTINTSTTSILDATLKSLIYISNSIATSVTGITGGTDGQILTLVFTNANTTMVSSGLMLMGGSINVTPTIYSVITMLKVPTSLSDRWVEVSRSIK